MHTETKKRTKPAPEQFGWWWRCQNAWWYFRDIVFPLAFAVFMVVVLFLGVLVCLLFYL